MKALKENNSVDGYISGFPKETQILLEQVRTAIREAAPDAEELISYQMPSYKYKGMLVHFAGYKSHVGFYPAPSGIKAFEKEISKYKNAKGSVQFPIDKPMPLALISKITKYRLKENKAIAAEKAKNKK